MDDFSSAVVRMVEGSSPNPVVNSNEVVDPLMVSYFNINLGNVNSSMLEKLKEIGQWVRSRSKTDIETLSILKDIKYRLGSPKIGESEVDRIHRYVTLRGQSERLNQEAKSMEV